MPSRSAIHHPHTVTFDCWSTLIFEAKDTSPRERRSQILADAVGCTRNDAREALRQAWDRHQRLWHRRTVFTGADMARHALALLDATLDPAREAGLVQALEDELLDHDIRVVDGAREALAHLAARGIRRALICDTGFASGRVVRQILARAGILPWLEVTVFSDETGVPKPHPRAFHAALAGLQSHPQGSVHVGDLRRSDIAGARLVGMGSIRIRARHDDADDIAVHNAGVIDCKTAGCNPPCERPEADAVADSYEHLLQLLDVA